ncbi:TPA: hypothetical protein DEP21_01595 [Patescibacteria group bacterium]|nr:hypothetical protein [Candidatus Gracilibacteria bacterium]
MSKKRLTPTQKYGKLPDFDDQKPIKTENNFRSNPNHKKHERRPSRPDNRVEKRFEKRSDKRPDDRRP